MILVRIFIIYKRNNQSCGPLCGSIPYMYALNSFASYTRISKRFHTYQTKAFLFFSKPFVDIFLFFLGGGNSLVNFIVVFLFLVLFVSWFLSLVVFVQMFIFDGTICKNSNFTFLSVIFNWFFSRSLWETVVYQLWILHCRIVTNLTVWSNSLFVVKSEFWISWTRNQRFFLSIK